jgi:hypothetical protein
MCTNSKHIVISVFISLLLSACFCNNETGRTTDVDLHSEAVIFNDSLNKAEDESDQDRLGFILDSLKSKEIKIAFIIADRYIFIGSSIEVLGKGDLYRVEQLYVFDAKRGRNASKELYNILFLRIKQMECSPTTFIGLTLSVMPTISNCNFI